MVPLLQSGQRGQHGRMLVESGGCSCCCLILVCWCWHLWLSLLFMLQLGLVGSCRCCCCWSLLVACWWQLWLVQHCSCAAISWWQCVRAGPVWFLGDNVSPINRSCILLVVADPYCMPSSPASWFIVSSVGLFLLRCHPDASPPIAPSPFDCFVFSCYLLPAKIILHWCKDHCDEEQEMSHQRCSFERVFWRKCEVLRNRTLSTRPFGARKFRARAKPDLPKSTSNLFQSTYS